ncbi:MAG: glycosyltransferase [Cryobacterium sp.]
MDSPSTLVFERQKRLLTAAYWLLKPVSMLRRTVSWVVGTEEIALMVSHISGAVPGSYSVVHKEHAFYSVDYDLTIQRDSSRIAKYRRLFGGPLALAWLLHRARGFIYVGSAGFLQDQVDQREFEFEFVKKHGGKIVCYFTGNDIRSPRLMKELEATMGTPNIATHLVEVNPVFGLEEYETARRDRARVADRFADAIFSVRVDQLSYLKRRTEPFLYFYPDEGFSRLTEKFETMDRPVIVHAPSKPLLKGTPHVRSAIERLRADGFVFDYRELTGVSNTEVVAALSEAHIVLNQFYAFVPGVLGIESMARCCALLTSADERIETDLEAGANEAWVVTRADEVYENLRRLLEHHEMIREQALRGYEWALRNASASADGQRMRAILDRL